MRVLIPTALACIFILLLLFLARLHMLQTTYVTYLDTVTITAKYCTATSHNYQEFTRCVKLIDSKLVPVIFRDCSRCFTEYGLEICYTCHIGIIRVGSETINETTYIAPTYVSIKRIVIRRGRTIITLYNITIVLVSDTYTSLTLPKNCTYVIAGQGYMINCTLPSLNNLRICDTRGLCIRITS